MVTFAKMQLLSLTVNHIFIQETLTTFECIKKVYEKDSV